MGAQSLVLYQDALPRKARQTVRAAAPVSRDFDTRQDRVARPGNVQGTDPRNIRGAGAQVLPFRRAPIFDLGNYSLIDRIGDAIDADTADCKSPVKKIAAAIDCNLRTAENFKQRKNAPSIELGLRLAASADFPHVRQLVIELLAIDTRHNALVEQKLNELFAVCHAKQRDAAE